MKTAYNIGYYLISAALCALGIFLIACPQVMAAFLGIIFGILLIIFGAVRLVGYFSKKSIQSVFQFDLASGLILLALGIVILTNPESLMSFICITMGIFLLTDGIFKIQTALDTRRLGIGKWQVILIFAIITVIFGLTLMFRPGYGTDLIITILGISMLSEGILNFITAFIASKAAKNHRPETIDIDPENYHEK